MNTHPGVLGRKLGMTQIFQDDGTVVACTVVEARPVVVGKRTKERDGYDALVLGIDPAAEGALPRPVKGQFAKAQVPPQRTLREFRCSAEWAARFEPGQELKLDELFEPGQLVDVRGVSRGKGFAGVMKRHGFKGSKSYTHGSHEYKRHGGSIGTRLTPGRVKLGQRMGGQMGNVRVTMPNQKVVRVLPEQHLLLIRGGLPGSPESVVEVRGAVKRNGGRPTAR